MRPWASSRSFNSSALLSHECIECSARYKRTVISRSATYPKRAQRTPDLDGCVPVLESIVHCYGYTLYKPLYTKRCKICFASTLTTDVGLDKLNIKRLMLRNHKVMSSEPFFHNGLSILQWCQKWLDRSIVDGYSAEHQNQVPEVSRDAQENLNSHEVGGVRSIGSSEFCEQRFCRLQMTVKSRKSEKLTTKPPQTLHLFPKRSNSSVNQKEIIIIYSSPSVQS